VTAAGGRWIRSFGIGSNRQDELDPENERVGKGGALPLESAGGAGAGQALEPQRGSVGGHEAFILWDVISESQELSRSASSAKC
jgi:hypothetical protein